MIAPVSPTFRLIISFKNPLAKGTLTLILVFLYQNETTIHLLDLYGQHRLRSLKMAAL